MHGGFAVSQSGIVVFRSGFAVFRGGSAVFRSGLAVFRSGLVVSWNRLASSHAASPVMPERSGESPEWPADLSNRRGASLGGWGEAQRR